MATLVTRLSIFVMSVSSCLGAYADCPEPKCFYKAVTLVVPFSPGGTVDKVARNLSVELSKAFGQPVVVDNKGGAGGSIGMQAVARSEPDSHTILLSNESPIAIAPHTSKIPVDPLRDLVPSVQLAKSPRGLVVREDAPFKDLKAFITHANQKSGGVMYGSAGAGTLGHLLGSQLESSSGAKLRHIPYKGTAPAISDLVGGQIEAVFVDLAPVVAMGRSGKLRILAVTGGSRAASAPDVPTFAELGIKDLDSGWIGAFFPAKTDKAIVSRLNTEARKIMQRPEFKSALQEVGMEPAEALEAAAFRAVVEASSRKWAQVVKDHRIKVD